MRYVNARMDDYNHEEAYRIYVTKSLQLIPQNSYLQMTYTDILKPHKVDIRTGDDIVADVMKSAGLHFKE